MLCYVCGGEIDPKVPHMGSINADGTQGQRHTLDSELCEANVDHAHATLAVMAHTLRQITEQYSDTSPVGWALQEAREKIIECAKDVQHYM